MLQSKPEIRAPETAESNTPPVGFRDFTLASRQAAAIPLTRISRENHTYLSEQIITYIGNKRALIAEIALTFDYVCQQLGQDRLRFLDLFSGSGIVSRLAKQYSSHIIVNDLEKYSYLTNLCYLSNDSPALFAKLDQVLQGLRKEIDQSLAPGFLTELYAPRDEALIESSDRVFYTRRNAIYLDTACSAIAKIAPELQRFFIAPLIAQASVHVNTAGVFKGFYKNQAGVGQYGGSGKHALSRILKNIELVLPVFSKFQTSFEVVQRDANDLVREVDSLDFAYFDPPYNQHPYGSNYFMLNLIGDYQRPLKVSAVSGIPTDWNRSSYNRRRMAAQVLFDSIAQCPAKFILVSYNSEGFIDFNQFRKSLSQLGRLHYMDRRYNTYRGCRNLSARSKHLSEYLFLLDKR